MIIWPFIWSWFSTIFWIKINGKSSYSKLLIANLKFSGSILIRSYFHTINTLTTYYPVIPLDAKDDLVNSEKNVRLLLTLWQHDVIFYYNLINLQKTNKVVAWNYFGWYLQKAKQENKKCSPGFATTIHWLLQISF